jgi:hypothetical protein
MCNICIELQFVQSNYNVFGNLFLKENKRKFLSQETYMSLEQSINLEYICPSRSLKNKRRLKMLRIFMFIMKKIIYVIWQRALVIC